MVRVYSVDWLLHLHIKVILTTSIRRSGISSTLLHTIKLFSRCWRTKENNTKKMKTKSLWSALLLMAVCVGSVSISSCSKDVSEENKPVDNTGGDPGSNSDGKTGFTHGHEWVDLGLQSGTLWATCNVGASNPEEYGSYFAWGETKTKSEYTPETYFDSQYEKYRFDGRTELRPEDDAATANWGNG